MVQNVNTTLPQAGINFAAVYPVATTASTATSSSLENPSPVSYTHLTLPTNREV